MSAEFEDWDKAMSGQKSACAIHWGQAQGVEWRLSQVFCYRAREEIGGTEFEGRGGDLKLSASPHLVLCVLFNITIYMSHFLIHR